MMRRFVIRGYKRGSTAGLVGFALLLAGSASFTPVAAASPGAPLIEVPGSHAHLAKNEQQPPNVTPYQAARRASRKYGGRVLNVVLEQGPKGPYYRVKLLDGGRVRVVRVEARH